MQKSMLLGTALACGLVVTSCGGGSSSGGSNPPVALPSSTPTPTPSAFPTPAATDPVIYSADNSQEFASAGQYWTDGGLEVKYDGLTGQALSR